MSHVVSTFVRDDRHLDKENYYNVVNSKKNTSNDSNISEAYLSANPIAYC